MISPRSLILTLSDQLSDSPLQAERIKALLPINSIYDYYKVSFPRFKDQQTGKIHSIKWETEEDRLKEIDRINALIKTHNNRENKRYAELTKGLSDDEIFEISGIPGNEDLFEEPNIINPIPLWSISCSPIMIRSAPDEALHYDNINLLVIDDEELYKKIYCDIKDIDQSIVFLNQLIFDYIEQQVRKTKNNETWNEQSMWFNPYRIFFEWFQLNSIQKNKEHHLNKTIQSPRWNQHSIIFHQARTNNIPFIRFISPNIENNALMHPYGAGLYVNQTTPNKIYETLLMFATGGRTLNPANYPNININNLSQMIRRTNLWLMEKFNLSEKPISKYSRIRVGYTIRISVTLTTPQGGPDAMELLDSGHDGISFEDDNELGRLNPDSEDNLDDFDSNEYSP